MAQTRKPERIGSIAVLRVASEGVDATRPTFRAVPAGAHPGAAAAVAVALIGNIGALAAIGAGLPGRTVLTIVSGRQGRRGASLIKITV